MACIPDPATSNRYTTKNLMATFVLGGGRPQTCEEHMDVSKVDMVEA
jgi:hypothetical protein